MNDPWQNESSEVLNGAVSDTQSQFMRCCLGNDYSLVSKLLTDKNTRAAIRLDDPDESGSPALLVASCFGYNEIVSLLIDAGADVNAHDARGWSALTWASNNNHTSIAKLLIENGADRDAVTKNGHSASQFTTDEDLRQSLGRSSSYIGAAGMTEDLDVEEESQSGNGDWYGTSSGLDFEETLREEQQARRLALEAGINLEVDLGALSMEASKDQETENDEEAEGLAFVWERCLPTQMFVFSESSIPEIVKLAVLEYPPQRNPSQKPVPANLLFLASRFAQYYSTPRILSALLDSTLLAIEKVVNTRHDDMTMLSFWISNCLLLQYYLRKDPGLALSTSEAQLRLSELISETYVLVVRDAERRIEKVCDESILDYSAIEGLSSIEMSDEWRIFRKKQNSSERDLSPRRRRGASPRSITSLLSSTLYVLEAYTLHPIIIIQALAQIVFWMSSELFNRVLHNKKYMSRGKAMDLRMNISQIEEWARSNNRSWQNLPDLQTRCKNGLRRFVGLLQLLQCISSLREEEVKSVVDGIDGITARQALYVAEHYRSERTETRIPRSTKVSLAALEREQSATVATDGEGIFLDVNEQLSFSLPTTTDLIQSYGAGIGGTQRENEKLFTPTLPLDLIEKLDGGSGLASIDRAKGYTEGVGGIVGSVGAKDYETLLREEEEQRVANLVGVNSGVW
ncbi:protein of unknown function [Taphrina deformans PYCC 5710]|uniref:Dilute domain-containing protein n=1 Tax=Taphrina deformans (strain PYCC 5710 / ATCC 11124 / CBS 356.35 / IMI 108563 / JCM 9778 / NBRC 8474) TaxID=1097556 RepID=R4XNA9_TAPDE|nr:protein of unknown function [Taphrina deformans PYCC 5710]|eukprot:CCG84729.1 protein of unknown function [Taphrina deformans PYCC 5710]